MSKLIRRIIKEAIDEFDWVPKFTDPNTLVDTNLVDFLSRYFKNGGYNYQSEYEDNYYRIYDNTGNYVTIKDDIGFSLDNLKNSILHSITRMKVKARLGLGEDYNLTIQEYQLLYQALEPLFK
jgi:hypothetical protein